MIVWSVLTYFIIKGSAYIHVWCTFAYTDVALQCGTPYSWYGFTADGLYPLLPCKFVKFSNSFINPQNGILVQDFDF